MRYFEDINSALSWYQNHVGAFDKAKWEQTVEERILNGITHIPTKSTTLASELIDLDLVQGSSFPKAKAKYGLFTVARHGLARLVFLPFYSTWWSTITSSKLYLLFLFLYIIQFINIGLYLTQPSVSNLITNNNGNGNGSSILNNLEISDNSTSTSTTTTQDQDSSSLFSIQTSEILAPIVLMIILTILHSQIIATHASLYNNSTSNNNPNGNTRTNTPGFNTANNNQHQHLNNQRNSITSTTSKSSKYSSSSRQQNHGGGGSGRRRSSGTGTGAAAAATSTSTTLNILNPNPIMKNTSRDRDSNAAGARNKRARSRYPQPPPPNRRRSSAFNNNSSISPQRKPKSCTAAGKGGDEHVLILDPINLGNTGGHNGSSGLRRRRCQLIAAAVNQYNGIGGGGGISHGGDDGRSGGEEENGRLESTTSTTTTDDKDEGIAEELILNDKDLVLDNDNDDAFAHVHHFSLTIHDPIIKKHLAETLSSFERDEAAKLKPILIPTTSTPVPPSPPPPVCINGKANNNSSDKAKANDDKVSVQVNDNSKVVNGNGDGGGGSAMHCTCDRHLEQTCSSSLNCKYSGANNNIIMGQNTTATASIITSSATSTSETKMLSSIASTSTTTCLASTTPPPPNLLNHDQQSPTRTTSISADEEEEDGQPSPRRLKSNDDAEDEEDGNTSTDNDEDGRNKLVILKQTQHSLDLDGHHADNEENEDDDDDLDNNLDGRGRDRGAEGAGPSGSRDDSIVGDGSGDDDDEIRSKSEWTAVTTNSEDDDYVAEEDNDEDDDELGRDSDGVRQANADAFFENHPFAWEFQQLGKQQPFSPSCTSSDKVSCTIWEESEAKKADLTVLDISATIIARVERARENSDYLYLGIFFSFILSSLPCLWRLNVDFELDDLDYTKLIDYLLNTLNTTCGCSFRSRLMLFISSLERFSLSFFVFFILTVAEKTYKQRFLYSKLFSRITSTRKAKKSGIPHFRLNKVRNIKTWLSVRSYLQKRGPQRSVNIIVSSTFLSSILLVFFLSVELLKDSARMYYLYNIEVLVWSLCLGIYLLRFMTLGARISQKYRNLSVIITEQLNLYLKMEQKPHKKDELMVANNVLKLAAELLKELDDPFKISSFATNPYLYNVTRLVILSAFSGVLSEMLGFKLKLYKIKMK